MEEAGKWKAGGMCWELFLCVAWGGGEGEGEGGHVFIYFLSSFTVI